MPQRLQCLIAFLMLTTFCNGILAQDEANTSSNSSDPKIIKLDQLTPKGEDEANLFSDEKMHKLKFLFSGSYLSVSSPTGGSIAGPGGSVQFIYALSQKWGTGLELRQSFDTAGNTLLSSFSGRMTYAVTGSLRKHEKKLDLRDLGVGKIEQVDQGGFRIQGIISQYYFNGSLNTVPYAGMGISGFYDFATIKNHGFHVGISYERIANQGKFINPISLFGGFSLWY